MPDARSIANGTLSIVAPCYNEEGNVANFVRRVQAACAPLCCRLEIVLVNDGSRDGTLPAALNLASTDPSLRVINLLRNFGHQAAATAGLDAATGDVVVLIDVDLQDPPEVIPEMVACWEQGADVAYGQRRSRQGESPLKLMTARAFYRVLRRMTHSDIPPDTGDFRLMDRRIVEVLRQMRERHRFIRGMVSWAGGNQVAVLYDRQARFAGETKYPLRRMISFALDAITSFSVVPLRLVTFVALIVIALAALASIAVFVVKLSHPDFFIPGFPAMMLTIIFFGGVQLLALGVIGEYVGRMYESVKSRPIYIVEGIYRAGDAERPLVRLAPAAEVAPVPPKNAHDNRDAANGR